MVTPRSFKKMQLSPFWNAPLCETSSTQYEIATQLSHNNFDISINDLNLDVWYIETSINLYFNFSYNALISGHPGGWPGDIGGNSTGFADFCHQFLAREGGIGPLLHFRGNIHGERPAGFVTSPPSWKWKIRTAGTGYIALCIVNTGRSKCLFVEIVILWLTRYKVDRENSRPSSLSVRVAHSGRERRRTAVFAG